MRTRVYISGPYTGNEEENTQNAIHAGQAVLEAGMAPLVPHLSYWWHFRYPNSYEEWLQIDLAWVAGAEAVLRLPGFSPGAEKEVDLAHARGIPVFKSLSELKTWATATGRLEKESA